MTHRTITALTATVAVLAFGSPTHAGTEPPPTVEYTDTCIIPTSDSTFIEVPDGSWEYADPGEGTTRQTVVGCSRIPTDYSDPCIIDGDIIPQGEYVLVEFPDNEGTTEWGFFGCSRSVTDIATPATVTPTVAAPTLPATGGEAWLAVVAAGFLFAGLTLVRVVRS